MGWAARLASRWTYPEQRVWFLVAGWAVVLAVLVVVSSASYSSVILAHTSVELAPSRTVSFTGTTATGALLATGAVNLTMTLTVTNPSSRSLALTSIAYKSWIEDLPMERGLPNLGRTDQVFDNETGTHYFFKAFLGSVSVLPVPIPPRGAGTLTLSFVLTRSSDVARFGAVQNITEYAAQVRGNGTVMPWIHWVQLVVEVRDLPTPGPDANRRRVRLARFRACVPVPLRIPALRPRFRCRLGGHEHGTRAAGEILPAPRTAGLVRAGTQVI